MEFRGTTICAVKKDGVTAIAGDGQVTLGESVIFKNTAVKVRRIFGGKVILGFAGFETSYGTTGTGKSKNNLFGIMNSDGTAKTYESITDSVMDFAKLVTGNKDSSQSKKYGEAVASAQTSEEWVNAIRDSGYNSEYEDGVYESEVMNIINYSVKPLLGLSSDTETSTNSKSYELKWWGDVVIVVVAVLLIMGGVAFLGLSVTGGSGSKLTKAVKEVI